MRIKVENQDLQILCLGLYGRGKLSDGELLGIYTSFGQGIFVSL